VAFYATYFVDMLLQVTDTAFSTIVSDKHLDSCGIQFDVGISQTICFFSLRRQVTIRNGEFLVSDVSADFQNLHSIEQRGGDRVQVVGCNFKRISMYILALLVTCSNSPVQTKSTRERSTGTSILKKGQSLSFKADRSAKVGYILVIQEGSVLLRVEHLEQSARRVPVVSSANLVDFINQNERILGSDFLQGLDRFTRHSTAWFVIGQSFN